MSNSFLNNLRENPVPAAFGVAIILGVTAFLTWYFFFREKKGQAGPGAAVATTSGIVKPSIQFQTTEKILHPNNQGVETYMIEYATGTSSAKFIDIVINWSNGAGFKESNIKSLLFTRKSGDTLIDTIDTKDLTNSEIYVNNFETGLSVLFPGSTDLDNFVDTKGNIPMTITIETVDNMGNKGTLATKSEQINQSDLDTTLTISSLTTLQASPVLSSGGGFTPTKTTGGRSTKYKILFGHDSTVIPELSDVAFKVDSDGWIQMYNIDGEQVNITYAPDTAQTYDFVKFGDTDKYLIKGRFNNTGDGGYLLYNKKTDGSFTGWGFVGSSLSEGINEILSDKVKYDKAFVYIQEFHSSPAAPELPLSYLYVPQVLKIPSGGFGDSYALGGEQYMSSIDCEMRCSEDDDCVAALYTDTVNDDVNDNACKGIKAGTGSKTYGVHTHYSTLVKEPFAQGVVENPKFVDGKAVVAGTPWAGTTGWETSQSSSAHPTVYTSWHPFSKDGGKRWASWSSDPDCFVAIKYPREVVLKGYVVASTSDANNYTPAKVALEGSKDGTTWTKIKETTTPEPSRVVGYSKNRTSIIAREKLDANTAGYTHYRARIPDSNGRYNNLSEVRLYTTLGA